ncbi:lysophospholipid acyltransferase family protein [Neptuniibacter marinus]|uniref:lysophospholipid acyltransferase family protein n=1 Tax=Neptuniibacter marinus TaxID=1806670 RepID=UPI000829F5B2|nr:lysophospholipid acyltransferase family protein [Neptuniibacter marinus]
MWRNTMFTTPVISSFLRFFSLVLLKVCGWKVEGSFPKDMRQCVLIAAPHTTNWDMPFSLMIAFALRMPLHWVGKSSIFKFPFGFLMRWMGGIPVDRVKKNNMVDATVDKFKTYPDLKIMMAPEGTRSQVTHWKSGFYHIADGAGVPIVLGFIDYKNKRGGILGVFHTQGNYEDDLKLIQKYYQPYM